MTNQKIRDALASVFGFKPVKTVRQKLLVISVHVLLWGLFLILPLFIYRIRIPDVSFYYRGIINKSFLIILFYANFYYLLPRLFRNRKLLPYFLSVIGALAILCIQQLVVEVYFLRTLTSHARRRLNVIYPGRHMLDVIDNDHLYIVNLKIELEHES